MQINRNDKPSRYWYCRMNNCCNYRQKPSWINLVDLTDWATQKSPLYIIAFLIDTLPDLEKHIIEKYIIIIH